MPDIILPGTRITASVLNNRAPFLLATASITAAVTITSTTEVACITTSPVTFKNGRAYEFKIHGTLLLQTATGTTERAYFRIRRTAPSTGSLIRNMGDVMTSAGATSGRNIHVNLSHVGTQTTGVDLTDVVVVTAAWDTGSTNAMTLSATAGTPAHMEIWDVGPSSDYPSYSAIN